MIRSAIISALVLLLVVPPASAHRSPVYPFTHKSRHMIKAMYGNPVCGRPKINFRSLSWPKSGTAVRSECRIVIDNSERWDKAELCTVLMHEWLHLHGYEHSDDPNSLMYPGPINTNRDCARLARAR